MWTLTDEDYEIIKSLKNSIEDRVRLWVALALDDKVDSTLMLKMSSIKMRPSEAKLVASKF